MAASRLVVVALLAACSTTTVPEGPETLIDRIFAPATPAEVATIQADWASREPHVAGVRTETTLLYPVGSGLATVHIVSHLMDGHRHYGIIVVPGGAGPGTLPLLVYAHGGDAGVTVAEIGVVLAMLRNRAASFVLVVPTFRSEPLIGAGPTLVSEGAASPWDRDVDDALSLLDVAIALVPAADPARIGVLGMSRGAGVGLLMAVRDPRIDAVVEFYGPTDFFGPYVREIVGEALAGGIRELPGFHVLNDRFIQPTRAGDLPVEQLRLELVRRSPTLFADRLPPVQIHHGTADPIVHVSQGEALAAALKAGGRDASGDEVFLYPDVGHTVFAMESAPGRVVAFLERLLLR